MSGLQRLKAIYSTADFIHEEAWYHHLFHGKFDDDADTLILSTTIDMTVASKYVIMVVDDTDMLVILLHICNSEMGVYLVERGQRD